MLKKVQHIKKLGVFDDFNWDTEVKSSGGAVQSFVDINIIYGRNYSGKTTLSRIVRALETGVLSDKYGTPSFQLKFADNSDVTGDTISSHDKNIRVFNEDFVRENLRFITNPDDSIEPFAILGDDNNKIEREIETFERELGSNIEGEESGLFASKKAASSSYNSAYDAHQMASNSLENQLSEKATSKDIGIKYKPERFGDQNYTITKLKADIKTIRESGYKPLSAEEAIQNEKLIVEKVLPDFPKFSPLKLRFDELAQQVEELVTKPISESDKIQSLVKDAVLNRWVNEGRVHHRNKHEKCAFCDNQISADRWAMLDKHFDEESELLEKSIETLLTTIEVEKKSVNTSLAIDQSNFYSKFHARLIDLDSRLRTRINAYQRSLDELTAQLKTRKADILNATYFDRPEDFGQKLTKAWDDYTNLCNESDQFSSSLVGEQTNAKEALRLQEVAEYLHTIDYQNQLDSIETLEKERDTAKQKQEEISLEISTKQSSIRSKKRELNDEEKGAKKVNEYLNNFFGHQFLTLEAKNEERPEDVSKRIRGSRDFPL